MVRTSAARALSLGAASTLCLAAWTIAPVAAQAAPEQGGLETEEIYEILIACAAYNTMAAEIAAEQGAGPNTDLVARFMLASVIMEPAQDIEVVETAVSGALGKLNSRRNNASDQDATADFAQLDTSCQQIDTNILTPLLADIEAQTQ